MHIPRRVTSTLALALAATSLCVTPAAAQSNGGTTPGATEPAPPPGKARIVDGLAYAPADAPWRVKKAIEAANRIVRKPYRYGGGHRTFEDTGYDCSGTVSYALHGAGLLRSPLSSGPFMSWAKPGAGRWITVYALRGHVYVVIAGLRLDTGYRDRRASEYGTAPGRGPRWNRSMRPLDRRYVMRHPAGL